MQIRTPRRGTSLRLATIRTRTSLVPHKAHMSRVKKESYEPISMPRFDSERALRSEARILSVAIVVQQSGTFGRSKAREGLQHGQGVQ